ncbi:MAG: hypothetical protein GY906_23655 [bacterium]|nr:hypothetical protein [bacterium]
MTERKWDSETEQAYRRGVHQALALIDIYIHDNLEVDPASILDVASNTAQTFRFDKQEHRFLMHDLLEVVKKEAL